MLTKLQALVMALNDHELYSPGSISLFAVDHGFVPDNQRAIHQKLRIRFSTLAQEHMDKPDGYLSNPGQAPIPAWLGWRWKQVHQQLSQMDGGKHG